MLRGYKTVQGAAQDLAQGIGIWCKGNIIPFETMLSSLSGLAYLAPP
jgi:hypothetical protein